MTLSSPTGPENAPAIVSYCARFLPREMWHIYRKESDVFGFTHKVITCNHCKADVFPFSNIHPI